ncbi:MAG: glycosyltransferase family 4 protein [Desulfuromonadales bacterium]|nr:glycosyltransferase family 4 protein [Desulfuromonadales bacterium]
MHIALICPFSTGPIRGNITTVNRIADHLPTTGCRVTVLSKDRWTSGELQERISLIRPDLLHGFHAFHSGQLTRQLAEAAGIPYLITITGSDLFDPAMNSAPETMQALGAAANITCFDPLVARCVKDCFSVEAGRLSIIPQGVTRPSKGEPFLKTENEFAILLPAALRPVKGIIQAMDALLPLAVEFPFLRLLLAGGALDADYTASIRKRATTLPWVHLLGEVPYQRMGSLYDAADLVLNSSLFEGGMANSLLEAMSVGRPVLARDIPGNRSLIRHNKTGWLYQSDHELRELARMLLCNPERGSVIGEAGRAFVQKHCSPSREARRYFSLYERIIKALLLLRYTQ